MHGSSLLVLLTLSFGSPLVLAQPATTQATSAPATTRAGLDDQSSPKAALKSFARSLEAGDKQAIMRLLAADSAQDKKLAEAASDLAEATARLREAAVKKFGPDLSRALGNEPGGAEEAVKRIDQSEEKIDGEKAAVKPKENEGPPLNMVKRNGKWMLPMSELSKDVEPADLEKNLADMSRQIKLLRELTDEVAAGKYKTAVDARQALDKRIMQASMPAITTAPSATTTAPANAAPSPQP